MSEGLRLGDMFHAATQLLGLKHCEKCAKRRAALNKLDTSKPAAQFIRGLSEAILDPQRALDDVRWQYAFRDSCSDCGRELGEDGRCVDAIDEYHWKCGRTTWHAETKDSSREARGSEQEEGGEEGQPPER